MHENSQKTANMIDTQDVSGVLEAAAETADTVLAEAIPVEPVPEASSPDEPQADETVNHAPVQPEVIDSAVAEPIAHLMVDANEETPAVAVDLVEATATTPAAAEDVSAAEAVMPDQKRPGKPSGQDGKRDGHGARKNRKAGSHGNAPIRVIPPMKVVKVLSVGMETPGVVRRVADFGAFVDIGVGTDGLVHVSEMSVSRVTKASDLVKEGDTVTVWIKELDRDRNRISLTMVAPGTKTIRDLQENDVVRGKVTRIVPYAAFVDVGVGRDGMLHIREMAEGYVKRVEDVVNIGDEIDVRVIGLDRRRQRIDLSVKGLVPEPVYDTAPPVIEVEEERPVRERPRSRDRLDGGGYPEESADNRARDRRERRTRGRQRGRTNEREEWFDYKADDEDMGPTAMALALQAALANEPEMPDPDERRNKKTRRDSHIHRDEQEDIINRTLRQHRQPA